MVTIFHLSDLHIEDSAFWHNMRNSYLDEAKKIGKAKKRGEKLLVLTGDFHNYKEANYDLALEFLSELITALDIEKECDVFLVPGNHDVGSPAAMNAADAADDWEMKQEMSVNWLKTHNSADRRYKNYINWRLESYKPYCAFVRELGVYPADCEDYLPASVHVRCWRGKLNILHLNTTLVADGKRETPEQVDILSATCPEIWRDADTSLPALALGHNSFYDLVNNEKKGQLHRRALVAPFKKQGVCAYLCGDTHNEETDPDRQLIRLGYGYDANDERIPNVVGVKGATDENDMFSDFGLYLHEWDEASGTVSLHLLRWLPKETQTDFKREDSGGYTVPRRSLDDMRIELERLREELKKKDDLLSSEVSAYPILSSGISLAGVYSIHYSPIGFLAALIMKKEIRKQNIIRKQIDELQLHINSLEESELSSETITIIRSYYEKSVNLAKQHHVSLYMLYDYAYFLYKQNELDNAIDISFWLLDYYEKENVSEDQYARLNNFLGFLMTENKQIIQAEERYRKALTIRRRLAESKRANYELDVATTCNNLAALYYSTNRMAEAEPLYREALTIYCRLAEGSPVVYEPKIARTCYNIGLLLLKSKRKSEAKPLFEEATQLWEKYQQYADYLELARDALNQYFC